MQVCSVTVTVAVLAVLAGPSRAEEDFQTWSVQTYMDDPHTFMCNDTINTVFINPTGSLMWRRHGHDSYITNDEHFQLSRVDNVDNMTLTVKKVTDDTSGIYFCEIRALGGGMAGRVVKGLNVGGHKYHDKMDKYRKHIITGVISGLSVFVLVVGLCALDHFRYQSEEERYEKRQAKEERLRRRHELKNVGMDNYGLEIGQTNGSNGKQVDLNASYDSAIREGNVLNTQL